MTALKVGQGLVTFGLGVFAGVFCCGLYWHSDQQIAGAIGGFVITGLLKLTLLGVEE